MVGRKYRSDQPGGVAVLAETTKVAGNSTDNIPPRDVIRHVWAEEWNLMPILLLRRS